MSSSASPQAPLGSALKLTTGYVVSSTSMVSRAYLNDVWRGVIVSDPSGNAWLAATLDALGADSGRLRERGESKGGPPAGYATESLVKVTLQWGWGGRPAGEVHIANPRIVKHPVGAPVAVTSLANVRAFIDLTKDGAGPIPVPMDDLDLNGGIQPGFDDEVVVASVIEGEAGSLWPLSRRARTISDRAGGFMGEAAAVAVDIGLGEGEAGSPAFSIDGSGAFRGLVRPVTSSISMLLGARLVFDTIIHAQELARA